MEKSSLKAIALLGSILALHGCQRSLLKANGDRNPPPSTTVSNPPNYYSIFMPNELPPTEYIILNKMAYGPDRKTLNYLRKVGLPVFLEEQLNPQLEDDALCDERIAAAKLKIEYQAGSEGNDKWKAVQEERKLSCLEKDISELWNLVDGTKGKDWTEKVRPAEEVKAMTLIRAVYSKWQLHELLTQFWHNHFNVNIEKDEKIAALFPIYDRDVIRKNCMGNFRQFLEEVASSAAMGYYLDNAVSRASPANENYARELFELHTLGAENYLNHLYNRWREVPGATSGAAIGYIDQDVYEAARAFTGWTIADGSDNGNGETFPSTGKFYYYEGWHDNYQKRVLGVEFDANQPPMADGKKVLDIVAFHPATARRICRKLCQRLVGDNPPEALVKRASEVFLAEIKSPDQIKKVVRTIITSPEILQSYGNKVKNPLELAVSFLRVCAADFKPTADFIWSLSQSGYRLYDYHAPTGHPDVAEYWMSTNVMLNRWNIVSSLSNDWTGDGVFDLSMQDPQNVRSSRQIANYWLERLLGHSPKKYSDPLMSLMAQGEDPDAAPRAAEGEDDDLKQRLNSMVALIAMLPEFQLR